MGVEREPGGAERPREIGVLLREELRGRGLSEDEIEVLLRKRKRRQPLELSAVRLRDHRLAPPPRVAADELLTVEAAAGRLKLHVKTVLRFIHQRRLPATRVGKSYRIRRGDLETFAGIAPRKQATAEAPWMTSIVDVPGVSSERAEEWSQRLAAALDSRPRDGAALRADVVFDPERSHLKLVMTGAPYRVVNLSNLVRAWLEER
jgi:excisionase family DNA binding protein